MSNALAIAATMRVISALLDAGVSNASLSSLLGPALTTVHPPDLIPIGGAAETDHLNLFLYTVTMNAGWRNVSAVKIDCEVTMTHITPIVIEPVVNKETGEWNVRLLSGSEPIVDLRFPDETIPEQHLEAAE